MNQSKKILSRIAKLAVVFIVFAVIFFCAALQLLFPDKFSGDVKKTGDAYGLDQNLIKAIIWTESKYSPDAVSSKGAKGLMQMMPATAEWVAGQLGYDYNESLLLEPDKSIEFGTFYYKYLLGKFDDHRTALLAYNAGEGNVAKWIVNGQIENPPFKESKDYVDRVFMAKKIYEFKSR